MHHIINQIKQESDVLKTVNKPSLPCTEFCLSGGSEMVGDVCLPVCSNDSQHVKMVCKGSILWHPFAQ